MSDGGGNELILFNEEKVNLQDKRTYHQNIKFEFEGSAILLKLDKKRKNNKSFRY